MTEDERFTAAALRFLSVRRRGADPDREQRLLPNTLPPDLPFDVPLPPQARLVGSLAQPGRGTIVIDAPDEPRAVADWYRDLLERGGWKSDIEEERRRSPAPMPHQDVVHVFFWQPKERYSIALYARSRAGGSAVELTVDTTGSGATNAEQVAQWKSRHHSRPGRGVQGRLLATIRAIRARRADPLPRLRPPRGSEYVEGGSGNSSAGNQYQDGELQTARDLESVARHYHRQWTRRGWRLVHEGQAGPVAWSFWQKETDGQRREARWLAHHLPETPHRYSLSMTVDVAESTGDTA
jgi:hypothetical protein